MHLDAKFDGESDFNINRDANLRFDWLMDGQSQNLVKWRPNDVLGTQRVNTIYVVLIFILVIVISFIIYVF